MKEYELCRYWRTEIHHHQPFRQSHITVIYALIENCCMHGVEQYSYLKDVMERLPRTTNQEVAQLTPLNWKKAREKSLKQAA